MSAVRDQHAEIGERRRVYLLARKTLMRNTRIFKQARTLTDAGFDVVVIGIKRPDAPEREVRDGYTLVRLPIVPLHARLPRAMRRRGRALAAVGPAVGRANRATSGVLARALNRIAFPLRSLEYYRQVHRLVTTRLPPPAVVHANDLDTLLIGALLARRFRAPLIYDAQELYTGLHTLPGWYRRLLTVQEAVLLRATDRVIAVNPPIAAEMERRYRHRVDTVVLNCPPYEELAGNGSGPTIRDLFRIPADAPVFLFSGGLSRSRGLENAILALREAPHAVLVILGEGALKDELVALAEREGLSERVLFCDFVPHEQVPRLISSVDVGRRMLVTV